LARNSGPSADSRGPRAERITLPATPGRRVATAECPSDDRWCRRRIATPRLLPNGREVVHMAGMNARRRPPASRLLRWPSSDRRNNAVFRIDGWMLSRPMCNSRAWSGEAFALRNHRAGIDVIDARQAHPFRDPRTRTPWLRCRVSRHALPDADEGIIRCGAPQFAMTGSRCSDHRRSMIETEPELLGATRRVINISWCRGEREICP